MAGGREAAEVFALDHHLLVAAGMKAVPVAREAAALRHELRPALLSVERIDFLLVRTGVEIDPHVGVQADVFLVGLCDQGFKLGAVAVPGLYAALLVEVAQVEVVVWSVAHADIAGLLRDRRQPKRINPCRSPVLNLLRGKSPPLL